MSPNKKKITAIFESGKGNTLEICMPLVTKHVIKVEGPFDKDNVELGFVEKGGKYIYYAVVNDKEMDVNLMNWAINYDNDPIGQSCQLFSGGKLKDGRVRVEIQAENPREKFRIYAYTGKTPHSDIFVEVNIFELPVLIARSVRRSGVCTDTSGNNVTREDIINLGINYPTEKARLKECLEKGFDDLGGEYVDSLKDSRVEYAMDNIEDYDEYSNDELFNIYRNDLDDWAQGDLDDNLHDMIDFFKSNTSTANRYEDPRLTKAVAKHERTIAFIKGFGPLLGAAIKEKHEKLFELKVENAKDQFIKAEYDKDSGGDPNVLGVNGLQDLKSLKYPDKYTGLGISIDGTQAYDITLTDFGMKNGKYRGIFTLEIYDHFGLDSADILKDYIRKHEEFVCWFMLQHLRGYKPFITYIPLKYKFTGNVNSTSVQMTRDTSDS